MYNTSFPVLMSLIFVVILAVYIKFKNYIPLFLSLIIVASFFSKIVWINGFTTIRFEQILAVFGWVYIIFNKKKYRFDIFDLILIIILLLAFTSSYVSDFSSLSLKKSLGVFVYFSLYLIVKNYIKNIDRYWQIIKIYVDVGTIVIIISIILYFLYFIGIDYGLVRYDLGAYWLEGPLAIANIFGFVSSIIFSISFFLYLLDINKRKYLFVMIVTSIAILLSYTRSAWIGTIISILMITLIKYKQTISIKYVGSLIILLILFLFIFSQTNIIDLFSYKLLNFTSEADRGSGRFYIYEYIYNDLKRGFLLGRGTDYSQIMYGDVFYISSILLVALYDWGTFSFILFSIFFIFLLKKFFFNNKVNSDLKKLNLVIFVLVIFFNQVSTTHQLSIFWLQLGIISSKYMIND